MQRDPLPCPDCGGPRTASMTCRHGAPAPDPSIEAGPPSDVEVVFFGCIGGAGHFFHVAHGKRRRFLYVREVGLPWERVDGKLTPTHTKEQGASALHHLDGWSAVAAHDYTIDNRPGSNAAVFVHQPDLSFSQVLAAAAEQFPAEVARIGFADPEEPS